MSADNPAEHHASIWSDVKGAIKGAHRDYTTLPLSRAILVLSVPMVLEMFMQSIFAVVDIAFVDNLGDRAALGAVATGEGILMIVFAVGLGLSMGVTATVARRIGEKDAEGAQRAAGQAILLGILVAVPIGILGAIFIEPLFDLMHAKSEVTDVGLGFGRHLMGGCFTIFLLFLINGIFRGAGDPVQAMRALWIANLINIALDPIFIFGLGPIPAMGVTGAAVATNIGRGLGVAYQLWVLFSGRSRIKLAFTHLRVHGETLSRLVRVSRVAVGQFFIGTTSYVFLIAIVNSLKDPAAEAGYIVAIRIIMFVLFPAWGIANAAATLVGQNLGAGHPERAETATWVAARVNMVFLGVVAAITISIPELVTGVLTAQEGPLAWGSQCLWIVNLAYPMIAWGMVLMMAFNGAGDTGTPTKVNLWCHWILKLPLAWVMAKPLGMGPTGVFVAIAVAEVAAALTYIVLFRTGSWKHKAI